MDEKGPVAGAQLMLFLGGQEDPMPDLDSKAILRVAAVADLHHSRDTQASLVPMLAQLGRDADVLLLCGDLTHHGLAEEAVALARDLAPLRIPVLAVLGNHDHHSDQQDEIKKVLADSMIRLLDGDAIEIGGVGFAGVKGFASGFGRRTLEPWGESLIKQFVREAVDESLKLESALARLRTERRVALLHYAPIAETVQGEPLEIYPFLGSSRLEEPLNRFQVIAAFHGHAHHGAPEGRTSAGVPVYNVSMPLLRQLQPDGPPYRVVELPPVEDPVG
jgi:Icc-related predicted phosphoesterase